MSLLDQGKNKLVPGDKGEIGRGPAGLQEGLMGIRGKNQQGGDSSLDDIGLRIKTEKLKPLPDVERVDIPDWQLVANWLSRLKFDMTNRVKVNPATGEAEAVFGGFSLEWDLGYKDEPDAGTPAPTPPDAGSPAPTTPDAGTPAPTTPDAGTPAPKKSGAGQSKGAKRSELTCRVEVTTDKASQPSQKPDSDKKDNTQASDQNTPESGKKDDSTTTDPTTLENAKISEADSVFAAGKHARETFLGIMDDFGKMTFSDSQTGAAWIEQSLDTKGLDVQFTPEGIVITERPPDPANVEAQLRGRGITDTAFINQVVSEVNSILTDVDAFLQQVQATIPTQDSPAAGNASGSQESDDPFARFVPQWTSLVPSRFSLQPSGTGTSMPAPDGDKASVQGSHQLLAMENETPAGAEIHVDLDTKMSNIEGADIVSGYFLEPYVSIFAGKADWTSILA